MTLKGVQYVTLAISLSSIYNIGLEKLTHNDLFYYPEDF